MFDERLIFEPLIAGNQCGRKNRNVYVSIRYVTRKH